MRWGEIQGWNPLGASKRSGTPAVCYHADTFGTDTYYQYLYRIAVAGSMCPTVLMSEGPAVDLALCRSVYYHSRFADFRTADPSFLPTRLALVLFQSGKFVVTSEEVASSSLEVG